MKRRSLGRSKGQEGLLRGGHREDPKDRKDCAEKVTRKIQRTGRTVKRRSLGRSNGHEGGAAMLRRQ